jgi:hypothetical protein
MSVDCRIITGLTLEFARDLDVKEFSKVHAFENRHPALDEYNYDRDDREGRLLLICDGMNGDFLRLVQIDSIRSGSLGPTNEFVELPAHVFDPDPKLLEKMNKLYEEYTGRLPDLSEYKYAMWSQWY